MNLLTIIHHVYPYFLLQSRIHYNFTLADYLEESSFDVNSESTWGNFNLYKSQKVSLTGRNRAQITSKLLSKQIHSNLHIYIEREPMALKKQLVLFSQTERC